MRRRKLESKKNPAMGVKKKMTQRKTNRKKMTVQEREARTRIPKVLKTSTKN